MKKNDSGSDARLHPIQLVTLGVKELFIRSNVPPDMAVGAIAEKCSLKVSSTSYNKKEKKILVSLTLESGIDTKETEAPYAMKIELVGIFEVDETRFSAEHIPDWAMRGAPLILFPYLREHAFGLSSRCGFKPLLLPLLEVPTFKIDKPKQTTPRRGAGK
ncbi:MAG: protein-export chaperone SecB [Desulfomonile sp.]|jgi:preprotein translocase subunit SecB